LDVNFACLRIKLNGHYKITAVARPFGPAQDIALFILLILYVNIYDGNKSQLAM